MNDTLKEVREWRERVMELCEPTEGDGRGSNFQREQRAIQAGWALARRCEALWAENVVMRALKPSVSAGEEKE